MKHKHTPGPWGRNIRPVSKYPIVYAGRNTHIARVITDGLEEAEAEANANLIACAPELLEALQLADAMLSGANMNANVVEQKVKTAIAKAIRRTSMNKHTPGPWHTAEEQGVQIRSTKHQIAKVWTMRGDEWKANANLIAAAPDLLDALLEMFASIPPYREDGTSTIPDSTVEKANAAIAKATGEQA
jgi:hypothetical protein